MLHDETLGEGPDTIVFLHGIEGHNALLETARTTA